MSGFAIAGESGVTFAVQVLSGLVSDTPRFERVYCHDRYITSGEPTAFPLICAPNIPPTNSQEKLQDHNLLSSSGFKIEAKRINDTVYILLDSRNTTIPKSMVQSEEELIRMALECIRLTADLTKVKQYSVSIEASERLGAKAARSISEDFTQHDKTVPFVQHPTT